MLAAVMPEMTRPTNSHHSAGASALRMESRPSPTLEIRITGRRPKRSESAPIIGENANCISAQAVPKIPRISAVPAASPPRKPATSVGSTGTTMPIASMSSRTVMKMNAKAAWPGCTTACPFTVSGAAASPLLLRPSSKRIVLLPQCQPDRRARQRERLAHAVHQIAQVALRHCVGARAEQDEARRARLRLRDVVELQPPAGDRGWRMRGEHAAKPAVERVRRDAAIPYRVRVVHRLHQPVEPFAEAA